MILNRFTGMGEIARIQFLLVLFAKLASYTHSKNARLNSRGNMTLVYLYRYMYLHRYDIMYVYGRHSLHGYSKYTAYNIKLYMQ